LRESAEPISGETGVARLAGFASPAAWRMRFARNQDPNSNKL